MVDLDSESLFNAAAAITATAGVLVFVFNVQYGHSPVSKLLFVVAFLAAVFLVTQRTAERQVTVLGYGVVVTSGLGVFLDVVNTFDLGNSLTALGLLAIAGLLFGLRSRLDEDSRLVSLRTATYAFGVLATLAVGVLLVDVATGGLVYELQPASEIEFAESRHGETQVGSVLATNPTPLPERVRTPNYETCTAGNWSEFAPPSEPGEPQRPARANAHVQDGYNEYVLGFGTKTYPVVVHFDAGDVQGETIPVEVTSACPDGEGGPPYVALFEGSRN